MHADPALVADEPFVLTARANGIATLTLNRPRRFNPLSSRMIAAINGELSAIASDSAVRAIILAAGGKGFCAGHDLEEMRAHTGDKTWQRRLFDDCSRMMLAITEMPQPVIARVHGIATAAGCQLAATCDLAIAAETATFATPGVKIGLFCTTPMVALTRAVGRKRALEMLLTGVAIDARTAMEWGLVNRVVPASQLDEAVQLLAEQIAAASPLTVAIGKQAFYAQIDLDQPKAYAYAKEVMSMNALAADAQEGMCAFVEKRQPKWKGA